MNIEKQKHRFAYWDNIKGFLIFLVVLGHCLLGLQDYYLNNYLVSAIYMFHMSAFVFVSGYFSKSEHSREFNSILKLLIAYLILTIGFMFWKVFVLGEEPSLTTPYYSSWYLISLVIWRLIAPYLAKIKYILVILTAISLCSVFWTEINLQYSIIKVIAFLPFFMAGYLFSKEKFEKIIEIKNSKKIIYSLLFGLIAILTGTKLYTLCNIQTQDLIPTSFDSISLNSFYARISFFITSILAILCLLFSSMERKIPFLTKTGKNTLSVYILHRPITMLFSYLITMHSIDENLTPYLAIITTFIICLITGSDSIAKSVNQILESICNILNNENKQNNLKITFSRIVIMIFATLLLLMPIISNYKGKDQFKLNCCEYPIMTKEQEKEFDNAYKIIFAGDLILLEDQVKRGFNGKTYNFDSNFEYVKNYISDADFAIGVLEGPLGTDIKNYSQSNYDDGKEIYINYPDEYVDAIKKAGFDLVTTANNHMLDVGIAGVGRTIKILKEKHLDFTGTYANLEQSKNNVKLIEKNGLKMAIIPYTYGINNYDTDYIIKSEYSYISNFLPDPLSPLFNEVKEKVVKDFEKAKSLNPDLIIVLPHWGTQFSAEPDNFQKTWEKIFIDNGADIILGDHTHHIQPVRMEDLGDKKILSLYSPGNFANIYTEKNGDASSLVEVYIDRKTKKIIGGAIIPMWTQSLIKGNYRALPIYEIVNNKKAGKEISTYDYKRVKEVHKLITKIMLDKEMEIDMVQKRYYFNEIDFMRKMSEPLIIEKEMKVKPLYKLLKNANDVCFIGDSVTAGSNNNGGPWFEPITYLVKGNVYNRSWGGETTVFLLKNHLKEILNTKADLYIVAIGTNDIRYRIKELCAMTEEEYINNLKILKEKILEKNPKAKFVFIAPWYSTDNDECTALTYEEKIFMDKKYTNALKQWCEEDNNLFINPNPYIQNVIEHNLQEIYLVDYIHPNLNEGIKLYSKAVLLN